MLHYNFVWKVTQKNITVRSQITGTESLAEAEPMQ